MNFLDPYDITGPGARTPTDAQPAQSLNDEVNEVVGQLSRFWGGFRKQSQTALEAARKDFSQVVTQAQREITKLTQEAPSQSSTEGGSTDPEPAPQSDIGRSSPSPPGTPPGTTTAPTTLLSRLQGALPPNIVATVQNNIPESIKHATDNIDLPQLRTTLFSEMQRIQGVTRAQAEEYAHKSEALIREAVKEAGEVLRDAVKVLPPEEGESNANSGLIWDGTDMWMLPTEPTSESLAGRSSSKAAPHQAASETSRGVATRAEALLRRLKHDPAIIRHDPETDPTLGTEFRKWCAEMIDCHDGGIDGEVWRARISTLLEEPLDGEALQTTRDTLVPDELSLNTFWSRFLFRVHQIEVEEEKRKALLQGTIESEDDFTWEDDEEGGEEEEAGEEEDEDEDEGEAQREVAATPSEPKGGAPHPVAGQPTDTKDKLGNIRESSEDSYDDLSSDEGVAEEGANRHSSRPTEEADDDDSDWE